MPAAAACPTPATPPAAGPAPAPAAGAPPASPAARASRTALARARVQACPSIQYSVICPRCATAAPLSDVLACVAALHTSTVASEAVGVLHLHQRNAPRNGAFEVAPVVRRLPRNDAVLEVAPVLRLLPRCHRQLLHHADLGYQLCGDGTRAVLSRNAAGVLTRQDMGKRADFGLLRL